MMKSHGVALGRMPLSERARYRAGRRRWLAALVAATSFLCAPLQAQDADWPNRTVTVVVPFAAGGNTDIMARIASQRLAEVFKQNFVVENRVGAGGAIAASYVAQAAPDGYTLFFAAAPQIAVLPQVQKVNYDPHKDFVPVSIFGTGPFILAISGAIPAKTIPEFVAYAKTRAISYGSGGIGSVGHLSGALFVARARLDAVHVPFRGGAPAMTALLGGQVEMYFGNAADIIPHVEGGKARVIGIAAEKRMRLLPDVPTVSETYPDFALSAWNGFLVPAKTPTTIVERLAREVIAITKDPAVIAQLTKLGIEPNGTTPQEAVAQIAREQPHFDVAIKAANLKPR
ncbi:MAG: tripartite tricarboxylate transporter substrate binding protein [Proteobacteria bacterium]|nr:tripartite tricarboxylate transporter substrate binding protein [Pseudomonadota bacterium]